MTILRNSEHHRFLLCFFFFEFYDKIRHSSKTPRWLHAREKSRTSERKKSFLEGFGTKKEALFVSVMHLLVLPGSRPSHGDESYIRGPGASSFPTCSALLHYSTPHEDHFIKWKGWKWPIFVILRIKGHSAPPLLYTTWGHSKTPDVINNTRRQSGTRRRWLGDADIHFALLWEVSTWSISIAAIVVVSSKQMYICAVGVIHSQYKLIQWYWWVCLRQWNQFIPVWILLFGFGDSVSSLRCSEMRIFPAQSFRRGLPWVSLREV